MNNAKLINILENFILVAILLVVVHTFVYELSIFQHWNVSTRNFLIFSGLGFDLIFSLEFIVRTTIAAKKRGKGATHYWFKERGWVDFLSSLPLLLADSGPAVYILLSGTTPGADTGIGSFNIFKVVKAIRVTRILRLVRVLKIFGKIHNTESKMAQHHTATLSTTVVFTVVMVLSIFSFLSDGNGEKEIAARKIHYARYIDDADKNFASLSSLLKKDAHVLRFTRNEKLVFSSISEEVFAANYNSDDFTIVENKKKNLILTISVVDIHQRIAATHLQNFLIIIFIVLAIMFIYTRHFAQNISDVIHILNKGFRKKDYNLQIRIKEEFEKEEIFRLAKFYNDAYLPAKLRRIHLEEDEKKAAFSMEDLTNFNK